VCRQHVALVGEISLRRCGGSRPVDTLVPVYVLERYVGDRVLE
jgi:hypothetical protein